MECGRVRAERGGSALGGRGAVCETLFRAIDESVDLGLGGGRGGRRRVGPAVAWGLALLLMLSMAIVVMPRARAYGSTALWQVAASGNCDNPSLCASAFSVPGGFWVWAEIDAVGGNATVTDCAHLLSTAPFGGAQHVNIEITGWMLMMPVGATSGPMHFFLTSEVDTITGHTGGSPIVKTISSEMFDTGIPAAPGHYSTTDVLGFSAPGVSFQFQVVQLSS